VRISILVGKEKKAEDCWCNVVFWLSEASPQWKRDIYTPLDISEDEDNRD